MSKINPADNPTPIAGSRTISLKSGLEAKAKAKAEGGGFKGDEGKEIKDGNLPDDKFALDEKKEKSVADAVKSFGRKVGRKLGLTAKKEVPLDMHGSPIPQGSQAQQGAPVQQGAPRQQAIPNNTGNQSNAQSIMQQDKDAAAAIGDAAQQSDPLENMKEALKERGIDTDSMSPQEIFKKYLEELKNDKGGNNAKPKEEASVGKAAGNVLGGLGKAAGSLLGGEAKANKPQVQGK